jgi:DNA recombination protein RmuC
LAYNQHVLLVCPSTLLVTLQMINSIWKVEYQNRNAKAIADQGSSLLEKFAGFLGNMEEIQKHLMKSQEAYNNAFAQLSTGKANLISQAGKLLHMGIKVNAKAEEKLTVFARKTESQELLDDKSEFDYIFESDSNETKP